MKLIIFQFTDISIHVMPGKDLCLIFKNGVPIWGGDKDKYPEHIEKLIYQAKNIDINHGGQYWVLRATYLEKYLDPTYSQEERDNCYMLWRILKDRI